MQDTLDSSTSRDFDTPDLDGLEALQLACFVLNFS